MPNKLTTHQKILHVTKGKGWQQPHMIQQRLRIYNFLNGGPLWISESSLTRRLREMRVKGYPTEMKRANKSGAACVYRLKKISK